MAKTKVSAQTKSEVELAKAQKIMTDEREARKFFYEQMRPKNEALAGTYNKQLFLDLTPDCVATMKIGRASCRERV